MARHIGRHIPGNPTVIVQNMPAAGSLAATNHMFNIAPKDGSTIALVQRGMLLIKNWNPSAGPVRSRQVQLPRQHQPRGGAFGLARRRAGEDHGAAVQDRADHRRHLRHRSGDHAAAAQRADRNQVQAGDGLSRRHRDRAGDGAQRGAGARRLVDIEPQDRAADLARREEDQPVDADRAREGSRVRAGAVRARFRQERRRPRGDAALSDAEDGGAADDRAARRAGRPASRRCARRSRRWRPISSSSPTAPRPSSTSRR